MSVNAYQWENHLLALAHEGLDSEPNVEDALLDPYLIEQAYRVCARITRIHSKTFYLSSQLLPPEKRNAARALYAFSRISDDIVDQTHTDQSNTLMEWQTVSLSTTPNEDQPVPLAWADARKRYNIPTIYAEQLISGIARDLVQNRYETFVDLATYCYGVACTVGLMSMHITGFQGMDAIPFAIRLGVALQLTNILRDIAEDWQANRLYLPKEELTAFGLSEEDLNIGQVTPKWEKFMQFQINRVREIYQSAMPGIELLDPDGRFAIAAAGELYRGILDDIESRNYDVFNRRAYLSGWKKVSKLPGIWYRARISGY